MRFTNYINLKRPAQNGPRRGQVRNNAGGFAWALNPWKQLERFLILGTEGGTYYVGERKLTLDNCKNLQDLVQLL
ncbi:MAG: TROVE domain-containing protein, partial [Armatimonadetes bacterium]|nr:TROVE domain-containing protein [Armatimonadota bacterium]